MSRLEADLFDPAPDPDLLCAICQCVLSNPTEASACRHVFCHECIMTWLNSGARTCPTCRSVMTSYDVRRALPALCNVIGRLMMRCVNHAAGCSTQLTVEQLETHLRSECQSVTERCECGTELLRRDLDAHKDVCVYCLFPCSKCDLMVTARERNTHNCFLALQQAVSGQKYLLKELRSHLAQVTSLTLSQQLQKQLASFDRRTRNYNSSLATEFLPPMQNCPVASTHGATGHLSRDVLLEFNSSPSGTANTGNRHLPVAEARQSEENTLPAGLASPPSPRHDSAGGTSQHGTSSPSYYSEDESEATVSHIADDSHTPHRFSDDDDDDQFDAYETDERHAADFYEDENYHYSDDESSVDEEYHSHGYNEYDDDGDELSVSAVPQETYTDSDNDSHDSRPLDRSVPRNSAGECSVLRHTLDDVQQMPSRNEGGEDVEEYDDDGDDLHQSQQDRTGSSLRLRDGREHGAIVEEDEQPEYAVIEGEPAGLSEEQESLTLRLRVNSHRSETVGLSDAAAGDAMQASPVDDATVGGSATNHYQDVSDVNHNLSSVDSADDSSMSASLPASPSLQDGDDNADKDELLSPLFSQSDAHDDDDADSRHRSSDEDSQASSQRRSLRSHSHNSQPVSPCLSARSLRSSSSVCDRHNTAQQSSHALEASRQSSSHSWTDTDTDTDSPASYSSVDSDDDTDDDCSLADRRGVKRRRSATASDDSDASATDDERRHHKLHRSIN